MIDEKVKRKLRKVFRLALEIEGSIVNFIPTAESISVYKFPEGRARTYIFHYQGYYCDWVKSSNCESLDSLIKNLTDHIKNQK